MSPRQTEANPYRLLPSVDSALRDPAIECHSAQVGPALLARLVTSELEAWRAEVKAGTLDAQGIEQRQAQSALARAVSLSVERERGSGVQKAVNATGVVLHTGLGRAPVHPDVAQAMATAAGSYCVLEVDRFSGQRNQRDDRLSELLARLLGCEAAIAVNNNAAAAFLTMHTFAAGREAIVSRGELVEIGGSFRVPDVMRAANVRLVEVGATNRTRIADYERGITPETGLLMKVHTSNFKLVGFTEAVEMAELAQLGRERGIPTAFDLGSGRLEADQAQPLQMLGGETEVREAVESGIEIVTFSGDKLLGGPQAGLIVGSRERVAAMRQNPLYRATRLDKVALAGLEQTLGLLLCGRGDEIPARRMLLSSAAMVEAQALKLAAALDKLDGVQAQSIPGESEPGSGSAPGQYLPTHVVRVTADALSADQLASRLRQATPPVYGRLKEDALLLDPRALLPGDDGLILAAFQSVLG